MSDDIKTTDASGGFVRSAVAAVLVTTIVVVGKGVLLFTPHSWFREWRRRNAAWRARRAGKEKVMKLFDLMPDSTRYSMVICDAGHHLTGEGDPPTECPICRSQTR